MREIPGNFAWFGTYEVVCHMLTPQGGSRNDMSPIGHMTAGASAGVAYWTAFFPADVVKSKIQTDPALSNATFSQVIQSFLTFQFVCTNVVTQIVVVWLVISGFQAGFPSRRISRALRRVGHYSRTRCTFARCHFCDL
jgi:hypothetical protein